MPDRGRAIIGIGKRDAPYDIELPMPRQLYRAAEGPGSAPADLGTARVVKLMDQHALVDVDPELSIAELGELNRLVTDL